MKLFQEIWKTIRGFLIVVSSYKPGRPAADEPRGIQMEVDEEKEVLEGIGKLLTEERKGYTNLVSILQEIQNRFGYLPKKGMAMVAENQGVSMRGITYSEVSGISIK